MSETTPLRAAILVFPDVEELDFVGPWEVLTMAANVVPIAPIIVAASTAPLRCAKGLRILPDAAYDGVGSVDLLVVPGGQGSRREVDDAATMAFVRRAASSAKWIASVCTGSFLLARAGCLDGRRATTHWMQLDKLASYGPVGEVVRDSRVVIDGNVVTGAGVSAGIDLALTVVGLEFGVETARKVQSWMEYFPEPPFADVSSDRAGPAR